MFTFLLLQVVLLLPFVHLMAYLVYISSICTSIEWYSNSLMSINISGIPGFFLHAITVH